MTSSELEMLADHMGHSINIHTSIYRLQSSLLERTKVAQVLCAVENGNIAKSTEKRTPEEAIDQLTSTAFMDLHGNYVVSLNIFVGYCKNGVRFILKVFDPTLP